MIPFTDSDFVFRMELRLAEDRSMDSALVRLKHEHVQLKAAAERTAAELHQLRANRRGDPDGALTTVNSQGGELGH